MVGSTTDTDGKLADMLPLNWFKQLPWTSKRRSQDASGQSASQEDPPPSMGAPCSFTMRTTQQQGNMAFAYNC